MKNVLSYIISLLILSSCARQGEYTSERNQALDTNWQATLESKIKLLGHRNWIVVVDEAYPLQSSPGITTISSSVGHVETISIVNSIIDAQRHVKPIIYLDKEIDFVAESDAAGISDFRESLKSLMDNSKVNKIIHEDIIGLLDTASKQFNVLIVKTDFTIPYTSVFFQLDCKYWNADAEKRLRDKIVESERIAPAQ